MTRLALTTCVLALAVIALPQARAAQQRAFKLPLHISADAVNMTNTGTGATGRINIYVSRWTGDEERDEILEGFVEGGPDMLIRRLQKAKPTGRIAAPGNVGYVLRYARITPQGEGAQIVLLTDRPISGWEAINKPPVFDYPFTLIQLHINGIGTGEGKLSIATKVTYDRVTKSIGLETYESQPIRLQNLTIER